MKTERHWEKIGQRPHHGVLVPLFALHTKTHGAAGFLDLIPLIDWCKAIGFDTLDLLPLNESEDDGSPYNLLSSCALDPTYLSLPINCFGSRIETKREKLAFLRKHFSTPSPETVRFLEENPWLRDYGERCGDVAFYAHVQALLFSQMAEVKRHAEKQGVFLKGDLPLFVGRNSVDVAAYPELFKGGLAAGAPPDRFNKQGQAWGFPVYDWEAMEREDFEWWKARLKAMERWCHIYRIDHVVGLFRVWVGTRFEPEAAGAWMAQGRRALEMMIDASPALPVAEDLGTIPDEVFATLRELGICGIKMFDWNLESPYEPFSLTTVSTPDTDTLQLWWSKYPHEAARFAAAHNWDYAPHLSHDLRLKILKAAHHTPSYFHVNLLLEYLALFPELSWPDAARDRINVPGTVSPSNWSYRFRPTLEEIVSHAPLAQAMRSLL